MIWNVWLPQALYCGCSYELFWHLNPKKLRSFYKAKQMESDNEYDKICIASHQTGTYVRLAVASLFNSEIEYPKVPFGMEDKFQQQDSGGQTMTDADRFRAFVAEHNAQRKRKKEQSETGG